MRAVTLFALSILLAARHAGAAEAEPVLVLPVPLTDAAVVETTQIFDARLLVAVGASGRLRPVTVDEEPDCLTPRCLAELARGQGADKVLTATLLRERGRLTLFVALHDGAGAPLRRRDFSGLSPEDLVERAPALVAAWLDGRDAPERPRRAALHVTVLAGDGGAITRALQEKITALGSPPITGDRAAATHRLEVVVDRLAIVQRRHHVRRYFDGELTATLRLVDAADGRLLYTRTVSTTASRRVRKSSREVVLGLLVDDAVGRWMADRPTGSLEEPRRNP